MKKIVTMLSMAVFAALIFCGCGDNALAYVEKDAEWIVYGNTKELFKSKIWDAIEANDQFEAIEEGFETECDLDPEDLDGNIAMWGTIGSNVTPELDAAILILNRENAEEVFNKINKKVEDSCVTSSYKKRTLNTVTIDGSKAFVIKEQQRNQETGEWKKAEIIGTYALVNNKVIHFYFKKEPRSLLKPVNNSNLAKQIDKDAVAAGAISGDIVRMGLKHGAGINDVPHFGDIVIQIKADRKTLSVEGSVDISRIDD